MSSLFDPTGHRLHLTATERADFLVATAKADREIRTFCEVLGYAGCRISEAPALTVRRFDLDAQVFVFQSLKSAAWGSCAPCRCRLPSLTRTISSTACARRARSRGDRLLWEWSRTTAWRDVKGVMCAAGFEGQQATPNALRFGYGVAAIGAAVPLNMLSKWMGHAAIETTAIYASALSTEQRSIAGLMWQRACI